MGETTRVSRTYASYWPTVRQTHDLLFEWGLNQTRGRQCGMPSWELTRAGSRSVSQDVIVGPQSLGPPPAGARTTAFACAASRAARANFRAVATRAVGQPTRAFCRT
jgi:hypothetical protein